MRARTRDVRGDPEPRAGAGIRPRTRHVRPAASPGTPHRSSSRIFGSDDGDLSRRRTARVGWRAPRVAARWQPSKAAWSHPVENKTPRVKAAARPASGASDRARPLEWCGAGAKTGGCRPSDSKFRAKEKSGLVSLRPLGIKCLCLFFFSKFPNPNGFDEKPVPYETPGTRAESSS